MTDINKHILIGSLGSDPDVRYAANGNAITNVRLATNYSYKNKNGEKLESVDWHRLVFFGKLAEIAGKYLTKGRQIYVEGRSTTRKWTDSDGNDRYITEVIVNDMKMLGGGNGGQRQERPAQSAPRNSAPPPSPEINFEDDIPF